MSETYREFQGYMELFNTLLQSSKFKGFIDKTPSQKNSHNELKALSLNIKDSAQFDEDIVRNFLGNLKALVSMVYPVDTELNIKDKTSYLEGITKAGLIFNNLINERNNFTKNMTLSEFKKHTVETPGVRLRSYVTVGIFIIIIIAIIFLSGKLKRDIYPFLIFIFIIGFPLIVTFRRTIYDIFPLKIGSDDELTDVENVVYRHSNSQFVKDMSQIGGIVFLNLFSILMVMTQPDNFFGIMMAAISSIIAGTLVFRI